MSEMRAYRAMDNPKSKYHNVWTDEGIARLRELAGTMRGRVCVVKTQSDAMGGD